MGSERTRNEKNIRTGTSTGRREKNPERKNKYDVVTLKISKGGT